MSGKKRQFKFKIKFIIFNKINNRWKNLMFFNVIHCSLVKSWAISSTQLQLKYFASTWDKVRAQSSSGTCT